MSNFSQSAVGSMTVAKPEIRAGVTPLAGLFKVLKEVALATPLALFINGLLTGH
ncbi:hypothetical protein JJB11_21880 [Ramlibacter ginsenosidimutans]|uniref:Uncharacterized protein n=1 Tax=Ramlibacter ginsenosidimutans TaxID=502333 RepID=A0A934TWM0_9BURK|nr:hypothetical protein [Ramlibacter ginsenosidimutans]MBK6008757.1 hypothetical protein [Ramlibacter ginsenosidimutans]